MAKISEQIQIRGNKQEIFNLLKGFKSFPAFMYYINSLKVTKHSSTSFISDWSINIDGVPVRWKEEDLVNEANFVIEFNMIEGDYAKYKGKWEVLQDSHNAKIKITVDIDWGAPTFTSFVEVKKILTRKTRKAFKGMLLAIKRKIENKVNL